MRSPPHAIRIKQVFLFVLLMLSWILPLQAQSDTLISFGSNWRYRKGTNEVSIPTSAWRTNGFDDSSWSVGTTPFSYGTNSTGRDDGVTSGTVLSDMINNYHGIFLRRTFVVTNVAEVQSASFTVYYDDGFVAWVNGTNILQLNMPTNSPAYTSFASAAHEADPAVVIPVSIPPQNYLVSGTNVIAVQVFNNQIASSDLRFECQLQIAKATNAATQVATILPATNSTVTSLTQITVTFNKPVIGVSADDLLINGLPAATVLGNAPTNTYVFSFTQPPPGLVVASWNAAQSIADLTGSAFQPGADGAAWNYTLIDSLPPQVTETTPPPGVRVSRLNQIEVLFNEPVQGVDAADLDINGQPATNVTGVGSGPYVFRFPQPAAGLVQFSWAAGHGITDVAAVPNAFAGGTWTNLLDPAAGLPTVRINEFLAANENSNGLRDEFGNLEDWIELYNYGSNPVDLNGCALTDNPNFSGKWIFPAMTIGPDQYLVVFASGLDRRTVGGTNRLHTNFSLDTGGEYLGLFNAESPRAPLDEFAPAYPEQRNDFSFGRDATNALRYFSVPTPGASNGDSAIAGVVGPVHFTVGRGFFNQPFTLLLTTPTSGATIRYTTDGSPPTETSGSAYASPLTISNTTTLRAAAFQTNLLPTLVQTHTYIFLTNVLNQPANPPGFPLTGVWAPNNPSWPPDYAMDQRVVTNSLHSATIAGDLLAVPTLSIVLKTDDMFGATNGIYTHVNSLLEVPCSMELMFPDGSQSVQLDAGIEIHGGGSRASPLKHPFGLHFRGTYGYGKLLYRFFPDSPVEAFDSLVLRADYNNHWTHGILAQRARGGLVRDAFIKDVQADMGAFSSHSRYVHLYINGLYWGLYNPCEDPGGSFAAAYFGGTSDDYDAVRWGDTLTYNGDPTHAAYNAMLALNTAGLAGAAQYAQIQQYLDVTQYADYLILQLYAANLDWGTTKNWAAFRKREPGAQFKYIPWDNERTLEITNDSVVNSSPNDLQNNLMLNSEYRILFADRVHKHFFNDGALTTNRVAELWQIRANQIDRAIVGESARWGDTVPGGKTALSPLPYPGYTTGGPYTREENWLGEQSRLLTNYFPLRTDIVLSQFRTKGFYPTLAAPEFNQHGGRVAAGFNVTLAAPAGTIYVTTNGTDPRVPVTGAVSPQAVVYSGTPIKLNQSALLKTRALSGGTWSALDEAQFDVGELGLPLGITEIMYNPPGGNQYEFIELQNFGGRNLDVSGFSFQGITFVFPEGSSIAPGAVLVLANSTSPAQFAARYPGAVVFGYFGGSLDNGGERIAILDRDGNTVTAVNYDDEAGWPTAPDGGGYSLEVIDPRGDLDSPANWRASSALNGTPGLPPAAPAASTVVLNEIAADNTGSVTNGGVFPDWIELYNRGTNVVSLANWSLTDSGNARKFVFPNTNLPAGGYLVVWCDTATNAPGLHAGFALSKRGETVSLYDANTNRADALSFGAQISDRTLGRVADQWQLTQPTPGATNVAALLAASSNVAINEWLANPPPGSEDWIELFNRSSNAPVALRDLYLSTSNVVFQLRAHSFLAPRGFIQLFADELPGPDHLDFKLPAAGGMVALSDTTGLELERVTYAAQTQSVTTGRLPDGAANLTAFPGSASPGTTNYLAAWSGPRLNEILARNDRAELAPWNRYADWIELYNPSNSAASLAGMALGKSTDLAGRWTFPSGVTIPALGYLRVWCDSALAASTNSGAAMNTGFALSGDSEDIYLFNSAGQAVDSASYGFQLPDQTIGVNGGQWTLLATPTPGAVNSAAAALGSPHSLRINEWMAAPLAGDDWFELYNPTALPVALDGLFLTDDPSSLGMTQFRVAPLSFIGGGKWVKWEASGHPSEGRNHVNFSFDSQGEAIRLNDPNTNLIDAVDFGIQSDGVSQGRLPDGATNIVSFPATPTPDDANYLPLGSVVINEVLTHTDPPLEDAVELLNLSTTNVNLGGWYLSDSASDLQRYRIPDGTVISAGGFKVFYQNQFGPADGETDTPPLFTFNSAHGDAVYLSVADADGKPSGERAGAIFGAAANGVSFGRYPTSVGSDMVAMRQRTFGMDNPATLAQFRSGTGATNSAPLVGPIVISEIMYHPADNGTNPADQEEFIKLENISRTNVPLFDPAYPSNVWRLANAVSFDFPTNIVIPINGSLAIVPFDPATDTAALNVFRTRYGTNGTLAGPYSGKLDNAGETLELWHPDTPQAPPHADAGFVPQILVERVAYSDVSPWPTGANGTGNSLHRINPAAYGNDPLNWAALPPVVGPSFATADADGDGLPNGWELLHGTDPFVPDADADPDHDGMSNWQEYLAGTDPQSASSYLKLDATIAALGIVRLQFLAISNHTYTVLYKPQLDAGTWLRVADVESRNTNRVETITDPVGLTTNRFYRLVTPQWP